MDPPTTFGVLESQYENVQVTNVKPYAIFAGYMITCLSTAVFIACRAIQGFLALDKLAAVPKKDVWLFTALAVGSLLTTWSYMFQYFGFSYRNWLTLRANYALDLTTQHWGLWLKETSLFKEAWEMVIVDHERYWWSHQIFSFAVGLGLYMEQKGIRRGIKYTWAFMLLGQIVAISFATNLFFLTLLVSPPVPQVLRSSTGARRWSGPWVLNCATILTTAVSVHLLAVEKYWFHPTLFMPVLLAPHVALLFTPIARLILPAHFLDEDPQFVAQTYSYMWLFTIVNAGVMLVWNTIRVLPNGGLQGIRQAFYEHPAVSSVGYDVIFCWISWGCWLLTQRRKSGQERLGELRGGKRQEPKRTPL